MAEEAERRLGALKAARELAHVATSLAAEAATLARTFGLVGGFDASIATSQRALEAARAAFDADANARGVAPDLAEALRCALRSLDAAEEAVRVSRLAVEQAALGVAGAASGTRAGAG